MIDVPNFMKDELERMMWSRCSWIGDSAFLLDPLKETQAMKMQVDEQYMSRSAAVTSVTGGSYERVVDELAEEKLMREERGLPEPGSVNKSENVSTTTVEDGEKDSDK